MRNPMEQDEGHAGRRHGGRETSRHLRGSSLLVGGRFISLALNLAVQVLIVRYLSKEDFGAFAYAISLVALASTVVAFGFDKALARFAAMYAERRDYPRMFGSMALACSAHVSARSGVRSPLEK